MFGSDFALLSAPPEFTTQVGLILPPQIIGFSLSCRNWCCIMAFTTSMKWKLHLTFSHLVGPSCQKVLHQHRVADGFVPPMNHAVLTSAKSQEMNGPLWNFQGWMWVWAHTVCLLCCVHNKTDVGGVQRSSPVSNELTFRDTWRDWKMRMTGTQTKANSTANERQIQKEKGRRVMLARGTSKFGRSFIYSHDWILSESPCIYLSVISFSRAKGELNLKSIFHETLRTTITHSLLPRLVSQFLLRGDPGTTTSMGGIFVPTIPFASWGVAPGSFTTDSSNQATAGRFSKATKSF